MDTTTKPLRGMEIVRKLLAVKRQVQREAVENYQNNPEIRAIADKLKEINGKRKPV